MHEQRSLMTLKEALDKGEITSKSLVTKTLKAVQVSEKTLNAMADLNPHALYEAAESDRLRSLGAMRSPLEGIPVVVKDNIFTEGAMRTTANAEVLKHYYAPYDADVVKRLKDAGAIIIGKANLSEFAYFMAMGTMPSGYGSLHGQVVHPYNKKIDPLGSSTGSAVAVAAGYVPLAIGTETNGSLVSPAKQNSIVTIKPTLHVVSQHGIIPVSSRQDCAGPMTRSVQDAALALDIIAQEKPWKQSCLEACQDDVSTLRVGVLRLWDHPFSASQNTVIKEAKDVFLKLGVCVKDLKFRYDLPSNLETLPTEFKHDIDAFLGNPHHQFPVKSLLELIKYNQAHHRKNLRYGQGMFYQSFATEGNLKASHYRQAVEKTTLAIEAFLRRFEEDAIDVLITPQVTSYAAVGGLPVLSVPAKPLNDENPESLQFIANPYREDLVFKAAYAYEQATKHRIPPKRESENG